MAFMAMKKKLDERARKKEFDDVCQRLCTGNENTRCDNLWGCKITDKPGQVKLKVWENV